MAGTLEATPPASQPWTGAHFIAHRVAVADNACVRIGGVVAGADHAGHPDAARTGALLLRQRRTGVVRRVPLDLSDGAAHATLDAGFLAPDHDGPPVWDLFASFDRAPEQPVTGVEGAVGPARVADLEGRHVRLRAFVNDDGGLALEGRALRPHAEVQRVRVEADRVVLTGYLPDGADGAPGAQLVARRRRDGAERAGRAALDGDAFTAELPLGALAVPGAADEIWDLALTVGDEELRVGARLDDVPHKRAVIVYPARRVAVDGTVRELQPYFTRDNNLSVRSRPPRGEAPAAAAPAPDLDPELEAEQEAEAERRPEPEPASKPEPARRPKPAGRPRLWPPHVAALTVGRAVRRRVRDRRPPDANQRVAEAILRPLAVGRRRAGGAAATDRRVRFLIIHAYGMGGTIRTVLNVAGHLAQDREVEVISVLRRRDEPFFPVAPGVQITGLDDQRPGAHAPRGWRGRAIEALRRRPSLLMHFQDHAYDACSLWTDLLLLRKLRSLSPGVLVGTRPGLNLVSELLAPRGVVVVGQEHMHLQSHRPYLAAAIRRRYRNLDALAVLTDEDLEDYGRLLAGSATRVLRIPNAPPPLEGVADPRAKRVIAAGRLTSQKGYDMLIPAWAPVARRHPDWQLRIYGAGRKRARLRELILEHDLYNEVLLMGRTDRMDEEMAKGSIFALSSRREGFPMVLLEAMTTGLAVASFDCPTGPGELITDGRDGVLVPPRDVEALSAALLELIEDEDKRRRYGEAARERARAFSIAAMGAKWERLFADLVAARRGGRG